MVDTMRTLVFIRGFAYFVKFIKLWELFSGKRGPGTHKRGKNKHKESFAKISLYNMSVSLHALKNSFLNLETEQS